MLLIVLDLGRSVLSLRSLFPSSCHSGASNSISYVYRLWCRFSMGVQQILKKLKIWKYCVALHVRLLSSELRGVYVKRQQKDKIRQKGYIRKNIKCVCVCVGGGGTIYGLESMFRTFCYTILSSFYRTLFSLRCRVNHVTSVANYANRNCRHRPRLWSLFRLKKWQNAFSWNIFFCDDISIWLFLIFAFVLSFAT